MLFRSLILTVGPKLPISRKPEILMVLIPEEDSVSLVILICALVLFVAVIGVAKSVSSTRWKVISPLLLRGAVESYVIVPSDVGINVLPARSVNTGLIVFNSSVPPVIEMFSIVNGEASVMGIAKVNFLLSLTPPVTAALVIFATSVQLVKSIDTIPEKLTSVAGVKVRSTSVLPV